MKGWKLVLAMIVGVLLGVGGTFVIVTYVAPTTQKTGNPPPPAMGGTPVVTPKDKAEPPAKVEPAKMPEKYVMVIARGESKKKDCVLDFVGVEVDERANWGGKKPTDVVVAGTVRTYPKHVFRYRGTCKGDKVEISYQGLPFGDWYLDLYTPEGVPVLYADKK